MSRARALRAAAGSLLLTVLLAQFVRRPDLDNPPSGPENSMHQHVQVPSEIDSMIRRACYDCHSNETRWPAYAWVAPVSWLVARDVRRARSDLNFSEWGTDPDREPTPTQRLGGICSDLRKGIMPPRSYLLMHPRARVSNIELERICQWTLEAREQLQR